MAMENLITYSLDRAHVSPRSGICLGLHLPEVPLGQRLQAGYQLTGAADFNGDGSPDYVLYDPSTQRTAIWYMNNNVLLSDSFGPALPGAWNLVAP